MSQQGRHCDWVWPALAAVLPFVALGCGPTGDTSGEAPSTDTRTTPAIPAPEEERAPFLSLRAGPPGTDVSITMEHLAVSQRVGIGFGSMSGHEILGRADADREGFLSTSVGVPAGAEPGPHFFLVTDQTDRPIAISNVFIVTAPDRSLLVRGWITDEGVECTAMRGEEGELYTLVGVLGDASPGESVEVAGTISEISMCQQGLTVDVSQLRRSP